MNAKYVSKASFYKRCVLFDVAVSPNVSDPYRSTGLPLVLNILNLVLVFNTQFLQTAEAFGRLADLLYFGCNILVCATCGTNYAT